MFAYFRKVVEFCHILDSFWTPKSSLSLFWEGPQIIKKIMNVLVRFWCHKWTSKSIKNRPNFDDFLDPHFGGTPEPFWGRFWSHFEVKFGWFLSGLCYMFHHTMLYNLVREQYRRDFCRKVGKRGIARKTDVTMRKEVGTEGSSHTH